MKVDIFFQDMKKSLVLMVIGLVASSHLPQLTIVSFCRNKTQPG
jgi:hypothetical protein